MLAAGRKRTRPAALVRSHEQALDVGVAAGVYGWTGISLV